MANKTFTDQMSQEWTIDFPPKRIISLVPSQTELLHYLGLEEEVIGITKFCVHPEEWFRSKKRVGGTKTANLEKIAELKPDLIIGNKEENQKEQIEALSEKYPVWMSDIKTLEDAFEMIEKIGILTNRTKKATELSNVLRQKFVNLSEGQVGKANLKVAYFIWKDPYMVAGGGTFIHEILKNCGFLNVYGDVDRYPEIQLENLKTEKPDLIFLSSEPYPFKEKHFDVFEKACPDAKILVVDGEMFSWYGSRLLDSIGYFEALYTRIG